MAPQAADLPDELVRLFPDGSATGRILRVQLPAERTVQPDHDPHDRPAFWLSDSPAIAGLWPRLRAAHDGSGLWPLLLEGLDGEPSRPWQEGEVCPSQMSSP